MVTPVKWVPRSKAIVREFPLVDLHYISPGTVTLCEAYGDKSKSTSEMCVPSGEGNTGPSRMKGTETDDLPSVRSWSP